MPGYNRCLQPLRLMDASNRHKKNPRLRGYCLFPREEDTNPSRLRETADVTATGKYSAGAKSYNSKWRMSILGVVAQTAKFLLNCFYSGLHMFSSISSCILFEFA